METRFLDDRQAILPPSPSSSRMLLALVSALRERLTRALRKRTGDLLRWLRRGWEKSFGRRSPPDPGAGSIETLPCDELPRAWEWGHIASGAPTRHEGIKRAA
jgi:hypothetical protein